MRTFDTGATRDTDATKPDYEGFLSPLVVERFGEYMHKHRVQPDGTLRDSDNWQKGMPLDAYIKSGFRHFMDWWHGHRGNGRAREGLEDALCALLFNLQGYLHEMIKARLTRSDGEDLDCYIERERWRLAAALADSGPHPNTMAGGNVGAPSGTNP